MKKKEICEIKLFDKNGDCQIESIIDFNELIDLLHENLNRTINTTPDGKIVVKNIELDEVVSFFENLGIKLISKIETNYGLRLLYEC